MEEIQTTLPTLNPLLQNPFVLISSVFVCIFLLALTYILFKSLKKFNMADLFVENSTNKISHTKFWSNIAYFASTIAFLSLNLFSTQGSNSGMEIIWLIYLGVVASNAVASKWISYKYNVNQIKTDDEYEYRRKRNSRDNYPEDDYRGIDSPD